MNDPGDRNTPEVFAQRRPCVRFSPAHMGIVSLINREGRELVPPRGGLALGEFIHSRYADVKRSAAVIPEPLAAETSARTEVVRCVRGCDGVVIAAEGARFGFGLRTRWFFHEAQPWIDFTYDLNRRRGPR